MKGAALVLLFSVSRLHAQTPATGSLAGRIVSNDARLPLPYSIVAVPAIGRERFTDDSGSFLLTDLPSGPLAMRVRRLGYAPMELTFPVRARVTDTVRIVLNRIAVRLAAVEVREHPPCLNPGPPDPAKDSALATVFAQLRLNAQQFRTLSEAYPFVYEVEITRSRTLTNGEGRDDGKEVERRSSVRDWRYRPGQVVTRRSYRAGRTRRYGPLMFNLPTLLHFADDNFAKHHCFHNGGMVQVDDSLLVRIDLVASARIKEPDVDGSIYLDPQSFQIRRTELRMSRMPRSSDVRGMTGMEVTTVFRELLPSIPVVDRVSSVQRFDPRTRGVAHVTALEWQQLVGFAFVAGRPGEERKP